MGPPTLPLRRKLSLSYTLSLVIAVLLAAASLAGLFFQTTVYPSEALRETFVPNDIVNLVVGLPILLGSLAWARRGSLAGLLCWPGALLYIFYNTVAYLLGVPYGLITVLYLALTLASAYGVFELVRSLDGAAVQAQLAGAVQETLAGWVLVVFGGLFVLRSIGTMAAASLNQATLPAAEVGVLVADLVVSLLWIAGGVLLLQRQPPGYASGLGLLFAASMLFISLILFLLLQPLVTAAPLKIVDIIVVAIMGMVCFVPAAIFGREVVTRGNA
ncbi:MAG: hypothetical protein H3C34_23035 [Caldilineaceae bacterium]|nr:hypothetical protein [Caldilineaceae bacterium]